MRKAFHAIGKDYRVMAKQSIIDPPKTGIKYRESRRNRTVFIHQASAPGQAPANLTGALRKSITTKISSPHSMRFEAGGGKVDYAKKLEEGIRIAKRPYMIPAMKANRQNAIQHFEREIKKAIKK